MTGLPPLDALLAAPAAAHRSLRLPAARLVVALLAALTLILTASSQIFDANFYAMSEATAILAGDHPYRDFFEAGVPLAAYTAAAAQVLSSHRLIGEFMRQWIFIVVGVVVAFDLGCRLSRSIAATLATVPVTLVILAATPTYHYSKLFFFPLAVWAACRYLDQPNPRRGAVLAVIAALAFLFRHDYGVYIGFGSIVALTLARAVIPATRGIGPAVKDVAAYALVTACVLMPWAIVVHANEGLVEYTQLRAELFQRPAGFVYSSLLRINPLRELMPDPAPPPRPATVVFQWRDGVDQTLRHRLEREHGLRFLEREAVGGRWRYALANVYNVDLLRLNRYIDDTEGFAWDRVQEIRLRLPSRDNAAMWLQQMALLVPFFLLGWAGLSLWQSRGRLSAVPPETWRIILAAAFLALVDAALLRQPSYIVAVAPITASLSAPFLASGRPLSRGGAMVLLAATTFAALAWARDAPPLKSPSQIPRWVSETFAQLTAYPPDYGYWMFGYLRDCTAPGDRVLVTGVAPLHVSYYAQRPMAGGQLNWHRGWRSDPVHEAQTLALLHRQSVPFAVSTDDPVLKDFERYPKIHEYLVKNYQELEGTGGRVLVDRRRQPGSQFGSKGYPCFR